MAAVAPAVVHELDGWLVAITPGTLRRAASAVPLRHDISGSSRTLDAIEDAFSEEGVPPAFRLCDAPGLDGVRRELVRRGYVAEQPTLVQVGEAMQMRQITMAEPALLMARPDDGWTSIFTSEGFDPVDGAHRVAALSRSPDAIYAAVREEELTVAVGVAAFASGWVSVHGMRTARARRGEGLAGRVLAGLADSALARGIEQVFLQVEEGNSAANALYARAGFEPAWRYLYWSRRG